MKIKLYWKTGSYKLDIRTSLRCKIPLFQFNTIIETSRRDIILNIPTMHSKHCNFTSFISKKNCFRSCSISSVLFWVGLLSSFYPNGGSKHGTALFMCLIWGQGTHIAIVLNVPWLWRQINLNRTEVIGRYQFLLISNLCQTLYYLLYRYYLFTDII